MKSYTLKRKKKSGESNYENGLLWMLFIGFLVTVVIFSIGNLYNHPSADDYTFAVQMKKIIMQDGSFVDMVRQLTNGMSDIYLNWQGTYFGNLLLLLNPMIYSMGYYKVAGVVFQIGLYISVFIFIWTFFKKILKLSLKSVVIIYFTYFIITLNYIPEIGDWYYWYTGLVAYATPFSLMLLMFSVILNVLKSDKNKGKLTVLLCLIGILVAGTQVITSLVTWFALLMVLIVVIYNKSSNIKFVASSFSIYTIAFIISVIAPGNFTRASSYEQIGAIKSILLSFVNATNITMEFFRTTPILFITFLLVPIFIFGINKLNFTFRYPVLVIFVLVIWYVSNFTPSIFATGTLDMDGRVTDILFFTFILVWLIGVFYTVGWFVKKDILKIKSDVIIAVSIVLVITMGLIQLRNNSIKDVNSIKITREIVNGNLKNYDNQMKTLYLQIDSNESGEVGVDAITVAPVIFHSFFISPDKEHWVNQGLADYFGKKNIWANQ